MSNSLRAVSIGSALVVAAGALSGCTAGAVVGADGSALTSYKGPSTITLTNQTTFQTYTVALVQNGGLTFSFDPYVPSSPTNGPLIPPGTYKLNVTLCTDATNCRLFGHWEPFDLSYTGNCTDHTTGNSVPCALIEVVRCQWPVDFNTYGAALCTGSSVSGLVTTVGVLDGP
jgi:hypothetical protein